MQKTFQSIVWCLLLFCALAQAQLCPDWYASNTYSSGDKVLYNGNAYKAIATNWASIPPSYPNLWQSIPLSECQECNLIIEMSDHGEVVVDPMPDGLVDTLGEYNMGPSAYLTYPCGTEVTLTALPYWYYLFDYWEDDGGNTWQQDSITLTVDEDHMGIYPRFVKKYWINIDSLHNTLLTIDPMPDGTAQTFNYYGNDLRRLELEYKKPANDTLQVTIRCEPEEWYEFLYWAPDMCAKNEIEVTLNDKDNYKYLHSHIRWKKFTLQIHMYDNGSVTVDTLPDGSVQTFDQSSGRSVTLEYEALSAVTLTANPDAGYRLTDWGDSARTTTNPLSLYMDTNSILYPMYEPVSEIFNVPSQCNGGDNLKVEGLTHLLGRVEDYNNLLSRGIVRVKDAGGGSDECSLSHEKIKLGTSKIEPNSVHSALVHTKTLSNVSIINIHNTLKTDTIITNRLQVTANVFPDYVFKKGYDLKTTGELENFINRNGHLPGMPSEEEVRANGLDLGAMCIKLLEKIEGMTLYAISLNKKVKELKEENRTVRKDGVSCEK